MAPEPSEQLALPLTVSNSLDTIPTDRAAWVEGSYHAVTTGRATQLPILNRRAIEIARIHMDWSDDPRGLALLGAHALVQFGFIEDLRHVQRALRLLGWARDVTLSTERLLTLVNAPTSEGGAPSISIRRRRLTQLRMLTTAVRWLGLLDADPCAGITLPRPEVSAPAAPILEVAEVDELRVLASTYLSTYGIARELIELLDRQSPIREIVDIQISDHDSTQATIDLPGALRPRLRPRKIQLTPAANELFALLSGDAERGHRATGPDSPWLLGGTNPSHDDRTSNLTTQLNKFLELTPFAHRDGYKAESILLSRPRHELAHGVDLLTIARRCGIDRGGLERFAEKLGFDWTTGELR